MDRNSGSLVIRSTCKPGNFNYPFIVKLDNVPISRSKDIGCMLSDLNISRCDIWISSLSFNDLFHLFESFSVPECFKCEFLSMVFRSCTSHFEENSRKGSALFDKAVWAFHTFQHFQGFLNFQCRPNLSPYGR